MKKIKIKNIISYIINFILIGVILLSNKGFILNNDKIILKEMSETTQVSDLNKSINELEESHEEYQNYIQTKKTELATAITNAGVTTSGNDTFETITSNVSKILANKTNDATAAAGEILTGKTAYVKGSKITGTMANQGKVTPSALNAGGSYTIPAGYHNGSGKVTANSLANQTQATATAADITSGKTAWVNGQRVTGSKLPNDGMKLLWSQEALGDSSTFEAQTITLNELANYDGAMVKCVLQNVTGWMDIYSYSNLKGKTVQALLYPDRGVFYRRDITINDTSVTFSAGSAYSYYYHEALTFYTNNGVMYPIAIYGYNE